MFVNLNTAAWAVATFVFLLKGMTSDASSLPIEFWSSLIITYIWLTKAE